MLPVSFFRFLQTYLAFLLFYEERTIWSEDDVEEEILQCTDQERITRIILLGNGEFH